MNEQPRQHGADQRGTRPGAARRRVGWLRAGLLAVASVLAVCLAGALSAAPASAHARFVGSDPAEGAVLAELPDVVVMTYSEEIAPQFVDTAVVAPGGRPQVVDATVDGVAVSVDVAEAAPDPVPGEWQVVARVVSADGHPVEHTVTFALEAGPAQETDPAAASEPAATVAPDVEAAAETAAAPTGGASEDTGTETSDPVASVADELPGWVGVLLVLALLAAGAAVLVVQLRRRPPGD